LWIARPLEEIAREFERRFGVAGYKMSLSFLNIQTDTCSKLMRKPRDVQQSIATVDSLELSILTSSLMVYQYFRKMFM
jgi:hypothetical protein